VNPRPKPTEAINLDEKGLFHVGKKSPIDAPLKTNPARKKGKGGMQKKIELKPKTAAPLIEYSTILLILGFRIFILEKKNSISFKAF